MPALPDVPNVLRLTAFWHIGEDLSVSNSLDFKYTGGPPSATDATALAQTASTNAATHLYPILQSNQTCDFWTCRDLASHAGAFGQSAAGSAGTGSGGILPAATCVLTNYKIGRRYRGGKPRTYWPFGTTNDLQDESTWSSTAVGNFGTHIAAWFASMIGVTEGTTEITEHVNVSFYSGFTSVLNPITGRTKDVAKLRTGGPVVDTIVAQTISNKPGSQRRRYQR